MEAITKARKMQSHIMQLMYLIAYDNISAPPPKKKTQNKKKQTKKKPKIKQLHLCCRISKHLYKDIIQLEKKIFIDQAD